MHAKLKTFMKRNIKLNCFTFFLQIFLISLNVSLTIIFLIHNF